MGTSFRRRLLLIFSALAISFIFIFIVSGTYSKVFSKKPTHILWSDFTYDSIARAENEGKPMFIYINSQGCQKCINFEKEVLSVDRFVKKLNDNFVCVKVNALKHPDLDKYYGSLLQFVTGSCEWPICVFATKTGDPFCIFSNVKAFSDDNDLGFDFYLNKTISSWRSNYPTITSSVISSKAPVLTANTGRIFSLINPYIIDNKIAELCLRMKNSSLAGESVATKIRVLILLAKYCNKRNLDKNSYIRELLDEKVRHYASQYEEKRPYLMVSEKILSGFLFCELLKLDPNDLFYKQEGKKRISELEQFVDVDTLKISEKEIAPIQWQCMSAYVFAYYQSPKYIDLSLKMLQNIQKDYVFKQENGDIIISLSKKANTLFCSDYAFFIRLLMIHYHRTKDVALLDFALKVQASQDKFFFDEKIGSYRKSHSKKGHIGLRYFDKRDFRLYAGNSMSACNLIDFAKITNLPKIRDKAFYVLRQTGYARGTFQIEMITGVYFVALDIDESLTLLTPKNNESKKE